MPGAADAQTEAQLRSMIALSGADDEESLDEQTVERFTSFLSRPLEINSAGRRRMLASGLLSQFQVASLEDYRSRNGDVLSCSELSRIEGFSEEYVAALKPFISLSTRSLPGHPSPDSIRLRQSFLARSAIRGREMTYGVKYKAALGDGMAFSFAARTSYGDDRFFPPSSWSLNATAYGRKMLGKFVAGDFNARFGQGLVMWSGLSLAGFSTSRSFFRSPTGISPSWSFSGNGTHRGVAADFPFGRLVFSAFASFPGLREWCEKGKPPSVAFLPGANISWSGRQGQVSGTVFDGKVSTDFRFSWRGNDFFAEAAGDIRSKCAAMVGGAVFPLSGELRLSGVGRFYPASFRSGYSGAVRSWTAGSDERAVAVGLERRGAVLTADFARKASEHSKRQCKLLLKVPVQLAPKSVLTLRLTERVRPCEVLRYRTGARCDFDWMSSGLSARYGPSEAAGWTCRIRLEGLLCRSLAGLAYMEGGRRTEKFRAYLRCTFFAVDHWDDRIHSYERDAPGNFTVPAYYGRGFSIGAFSGGKIFLGKRPVRVMKLYSRVSTLQYPFMKVPKPSRTEIKLQVVFEL